MRATLTDPAGDVTQYTYDALDRLHQVTDGAGRTTAYRYDPTGRLLELTEAQATPEETITETYTYTANGLKHTVEDAHDNRTWVTYPDGYYVTLDT